MALVQWKQISPQLGDYGNLTGSLEITGSLMINGALFTGGGGSVQTLSLNGYELSISQGNTVTLPSSSAADTGSLITSASATGNTITFVKGDGSSFDIIIDTGSAGGSTDISALNAFTSSIQSEVDSLTAATSSYITSADQLTGSLDTRYALSGSVGGGSTDITSLNAFTASYFIDSASFNSRINSINVSGDTSFNGDRVVSNTLLGDLYSNNFNAGTSGSIQQFLDAIFFPSAAPTATFSEQTSKFNTNLATTGTNLNSVSITDTVDDSPYVITLGGTDAASFIAFPTNADSSSWEIQAATNLSAATYTYDVTVTDNVGATRTYSNKTITIAQASSGTLSATGNLYIIESATIGPIYLNSSGRTGAQGGVTVSYSPNYGSQVATGFTSNNPYIAINPTTGLLSVGTAISGSGNFEGTILNSDISWTDQYGNTSTAPINVQVTKNNAPDIIFSNTSNQNTNLAVSGANLVTLSFSDVESDAIDYSSFAFSESTGNLVATRVSNTYQVRANSNLTAGSYNITSSIADVHGFNTNTETHTFTISQADNGTLTGDSTIYIIESALSSSAFRDATGYNNGNPAQIGVSYSPNYGSQVASFTSSNASIAVDTNGYLTLGVDISGSITQSGDTFNTTLTWNDQYGNTDSAVITANVFSNQAPSVTYTVQSYTTAEAISGSNIGSISIIDTESNSPFNLSLSGVSSSLFNALPQNANSSSWYIQPLNNLSEGDYPVAVTVTDSYNKQATVSRTITVSPAVSDTLYVYDIGFTASTLVNDLGILSQDTSQTPFIAVSYDGIGFVDAIESGSLGLSSFSYNWGTSKTATLLASASGTNANDILISLGAISKTNSNRFAIFMPSGSNMTGVPSKMTDGYGGSRDGWYVLEVAVDGAAIGSGIGTSEAASPYTVQLNSPVNGVSDYVMVAPVNTIAPSTSIELRLIAESGSAV